MVGKRTPGQWVFDVFNYAIMGLLALTCLYPMWAVVMVSFSEPYSLATHTGALLWPQGSSMVGYRVVINNRSIWTGYANTILLVTVGTAVRMLISCMGAYVLSRRDFMLRRGMIIMIMITMYFGGGMIPSYLLVRSLGLYNTYAALILPSLISTWNMLVLRTAFQRIPDSLEESARLDGANEMQILLRILLPVAKATIAVISLYYVVAEWNSWFSATIYLKDRGKFPLQVILREILISHTTSQSGEMAGDLDGLQNLFIEQLVRYSTIVVATLPILCAYPFVQRYFVSGVMMGSLKE